MKSGWNDWIDVTFVIPLLIGHGGYVAVSRGAG